MLEDKINRKIFASVVVAAVILGIGLYVWNHATGRSSNTAEVMIGSLQVMVETQSRDGRVFEEVDPQLEARIDGSTGTILYDPGSPKSAPNGDILLIDYGDLKLKRFDPAGNHVCSYGNGEGEGPGEFLHPIDFDVTKSGRVVVADAELRRLSTFDADCEFVSIQKMDMLLHRMALTSSAEQGFLLTPPLHSQGKGVFYYYDGQLGQNFGRLLPESAPSGLPLDGYITSMDQEMVYAPSRYPVIIRYNSNGSPVWARTTIDYAATDIPESPDNETRSPVPNMRYMRGVSMDDQGIYTYAYQPSTDSGRTVIDVYNPEDGTYRYSYDFPVDVRRSPHANNGRLYAVQDTSAFIYSMSQ